MFVLKAITLMRREVDGQREHRLRVSSELNFGHEANKPAPGTKKYNRTCMPYPFMGEMTVEEAASDVRIAIDGFEKNASDLRCFHTCCHVISKSFECLVSGAQQKGIKFLQAAPARPG